MSKPCKIVNLPEYVRKMSKPCKIVNLPEQLKLVSCWW